MREQAGTQWRIHIESHVLFAGSCKGAVQTAWCISHCVPFILSFLSFLLCWRLWMGHRRDCLHKSLAFLPHLAEWRDWRGGDYKRVKHTKRNTLSYLHGMLVAASISPWISMYIPHCVPACLLSYNLFSPISVLQEVRGRKITGQE